MPTCARADPFHIHPHAQTLILSSSAKTRRDCIQASSALKMTASVPSQNESSPARALKESFAKHLTLHDRPDERTFTSFTRRMCFAKPVDCFVRLHSKL